MWCIEGKTARNTMENYGKASLDTSSQGMHCLHQSQRGSPAIRQTCCSCCQGHTGQSGPVLGRWRWVPVRSAQHGMASVVRFSIEFDSDGYGFAMFFAVISSDSRVSSAGFKLPYCFEYRKTAAPLTAGPSAGSKGLQPPSRHRNELAFASLRLLLLDLMDFTSMSLDFHRSSHACPPFVPSHVAIATLVRSMLQMPKQTSTWAPE